MSQGLKSWCYRVLEVWGVGHRDVGLLVQGSPAPPMGAEALEP